MKKLLLAVASVVFTVGSYAQSITATWSMSDRENLPKVSVTGDDAAKAFVTTSFAQGDQIARTRTITESNANGDIPAVTYDPAFTAFTPYTKVTGKTAGHCVSFTVTPKGGHKFKPTSLEFDGMKVGTDGGTFDIYYSVTRGSDIAIATGVGPNRNRPDTANPNAYSHHSYSFGDIIVDGQPFTIYIYFANINGTDNENPKELALRNVTISGAVDEEISTVSTYITKMTFDGATDNTGATTIDITDLVKDLTNGKTAAYKPKLFGNPTNFNLTMVEGYESAVTLDGNVAKVDVLKNNTIVFTFSVRFTVSNRQPKPEAKPLNRGLMSINLTGANMGSGNLISWRHREADGYGVKYKLWRGTTAEAQTVCLNGKKYITDRTNFLDQSGRVDHFYKLEVYDRFGNLLETEIGCPTWEDQVFRIPLDRPSPRKGAYYSPNDASFCDMDGDGEYEIILKWSPSNEKDAASNGTTSPVYMDCIKLDGTRLWRIDLGDNIFTSAHTVQFIAWDFDGDGYGELMMKTAPGTIDGQGNYVLLGDDDPNENLLSSRGKQDHGSEYITVFDGLTGAELATIPYHTDYETGLNYWGDSKQNRSERYLAALAYLDGPDANPSPIFARGYYSGAFVGAYDWDGVELKERWVSRNTQSGQGLWGEGAHWISVGDCDGDGFQEIVYGSAALDHDGSLLYRTGLGHGDALHLGDFLPERPGLEVFMAHEHKPYGVDLRDAKTGELLLHPTASGDTGRGLAAHFDNKSPHSQFIYSASAGMFDCADGSEIAPTWAIGSSGAGINNRIFWDGDLYEEFYDKSIIAHWNHDMKWFDRYQVNGGNYTYGHLNNSSKFNPCVLGDILGDWREEIINWEGETDGTGPCNLVINTTSFPSDFRLPHLMDDLNYRVQVINQNCCYNQPPHLSVDAATVYATNPNQAKQEDEQDTGVNNVNIDETDQTETVIYNLQGIRINEVVTSGMYIVNGQKLFIRK